MPCAALAKSVQTRGRAEAASSAQPRASLLQHPVSGWQWLYTLAATAQGAEAAARPPGRGGGPRRLQEGEGGEQRAVAVGHALGQRLRQLQRAQAQQRQRLGRREPVRGHVLRRRVALRARVRDRVSAGARSNPGLRLRAYTAALRAAGPLRPGKAPA